MIKTFKGCLNGHKLLLTMSLYAIKVILLPILYYSYIESDLNVLTGDTNFTFASSSTVERMAPLSSGKT